jgi:hypothetical protein
MREIGAQDSRSGVAPGHYGNTGFFTEFREMLRGF